jgi:phosphatidylserine/phosphatidylglycerophosphate/cardiolipin synthase-like enzyme/DNA/RNA endonuclease YhcR with UshA esterase domain
MKCRILLIEVMIYLFAGNLSAQQTNHVVISEVYGGGGNSGATLKNDFIELYNPTNSIISVDGWSVHYMSGGATGVFPTTSWTVLSGSIAPKGYYLIQEAAGATGSQNLPSPDAVGLLTLGALAGKIVLSKASIAVASLTDPNLVDFVGYGTAAIFEGTGPASGTTNTTSVERKASSTSTANTMGSGGAEEFSGNGFDSNDNSADFILRAVPQPQNSASPTEPVSSGGDILPPNIISVKPLSSTQIKVLFNEPVDSLTSSTKTNYSIDKSIIVNFAQREVTNNTGVILSVSEMPVDVYTLTIRNVKDTSNNAILSPKSIQFCNGVLTISYARSLGAGASVRVKGIITAGNEFQAPPAYLQDTTGALAVFNYNFITSARIGDIWEVGGTLKDYNGLMEIDPISDTVKVSSGNSLPAPKLLTSANLNESFESQLVRINKVKFALPGLFSALVDSVYAAGDISGPLYVLISKGSNIAGSPIPTDSVNLIGLVNERNGIYRLLPRTLADINVIDPPPSQTWVDINIARSKGGAVVTVRGIVTYAQPSKNAGKMTIFLQDFSGGITLYDAKTDGLIIGDSVEVNGVVTDYNGLIELSPVNLVTLLGNGLPLPAPKVITIQEASEAFESQLVKLFGVRFMETGTFSGGTSGTTYNITDGSSQLNIRIPYGSALAGRLIPGGLLDVVGVMGEYNSAYQLTPRDSSDFFVYPGPQISSTPVVSAVSDASFTVDWTTFFPGTSVIYYGSSKSLGDSVVISSGTTNHSITVTGLKSGRMYYYQVYSANEKGAAASFVAAQVTTSSASSGSMNVYFNYSVDAMMGIMPLANGNSDLLGKLLERISGAKNSIDLAIYSFDDFGGGPPWVANRIADSLIAAQNRNVNVRVVFDSKPLTTPLKNLISAGISVMQRPDPGANGGIMHNKFFIFDGRDTTDATDDWVVTGSWNVTNDGTLDDAQNALFIQDQSLARTYTVEFEEMFGSTTMTKNSAQARFGPSKQDNTPHVTYIGAKKVKVEIFFSPSDRTTSKIIRALESGSKDIFFGVMAFTRTDIAQALIDRKNAGVHVRGLIDQTPNVLSTLQGAGIDVWQAGHSVVSGIFHHKYAAIDPFNDESDPLVITGSHNWSNAAEQDNDENTLIIHSGDIARQYVQEFAQRYKESGGTGNITGAEKIPATEPARFELSQNFPNPFNPTTTIRFAIPPGVPHRVVSLRVFDVLGREAAVLINEEKSAGTYQVEWDASTMASGVYFYQLRSGSGVQTKSMILIK